MGLFKRARAWLGKVGGFGAVEAQEAVPVAFNGAFLPSTIGMAVVNRDMKEGFKRVFMEKLRAMALRLRLRSVASMSIVLSSWPLARRSRRKQRSAEVTEA